jgi:hypothetical protein
MNSVITSATWRLSSSKLARSAGMAGARTYRASESAQMFSAQLSA